ncbi:MAG: RNA polymerase sigma factor, partial [Gammaproteobacteria bacterium]
MSAAAAAIQAGCGAIADFTAGVMPHLPFLQRLALKLTGNAHDAEDLVQDLMLKLLQQPERLLGISALKPWLARVMHHQHIDQFRRRPPAQAFISFEQTVDDEVGQELLLGLADDGAGPEEEMRDEQLRRQLAAALRGLPEITRRLVELHEIEGQSLPALAELSGIPLNTIKDHLKRARQYLRA